MNHDGKKPWELQPQKPQIDSQDDWGMHRVRISRKQGLGEDPKDPFFFKKHHGFLECTVAHTLFLNCVCVLFIVSWTYVSILLV